MREDSKNNIPAIERKKQQDCGCEGNCCPPKKNNILTKIIFVVVILLAIGIVIVKLSNRPANAENKPAQCVPGSSSCSDTTKTATCDTTKGSSCCPKK